MPGGELFLTSCCWPVCLGILATITSQLIFFFFFFLFTTLSKIAISQLLDGLGEDNICPFKGGAH